MATQVATERTEAPATTRETIPLWLAVAITVVVSIPFGVYLGDYNLPLFVAFIAWAEYFALGAKPEALRTIVPAYTAGVVITAVSMFVFVLLKDYIDGIILDANHALALSLAISLFVFVGFMVYIMKFVPVLAKGSLAYFNGISMLLAVYFTGTYPFSGGGQFTWDPLLAPFIAGGWAVLAGWLGHLLGWFNVTITFPHEA